MKKPSPTQLRYLRAALNNMRVIIAPLGTLRALERRQWVKNVRQYRLYGVRGWSATLTDAGHLAGFTIAPSQWTRIEEPPTCDLCSHAATWQHPKGGFRCNVCPRPEKPVDATR